MIHNVVMMSVRPPGSLSLISPNTRIKSLAENMAAVQLTLSSMIHKDRASPRSVEKLKTKIADRKTPVKIKTDMERLKTSRVSVDSESPRIGKLKITSSGQDYVSEMNTPTSLKIRKPSGSPERPLGKMKLQNSHSAKKFSSKANNPGSSSKQPRAKKFSIFKTRNKSGRVDENAVNFTDKTVGKKLSIRRSSKDPDVIINGAEPSVTAALKIDIDDDMEDLDDEFTQQTSVNKPLESPQSKMPVMLSSSGTSEAIIPVRRNIFGPHSPACKDEISPEKSSESQKNKEDCDSKRPASRTQSRVLSNEDAIKAIDAVVTISEIQKTTETERRLPVTPCPGSTTPGSLPLLSPHELPEESHSNMTTPSLPSLSPAIRSSQVCKGFY